MATANNATSHCGFLMRIHWYFLLAIRSLHCPLFTLCLYQQATGLGKMLQFCSFFVQRSAFQSDRLDTGLN